MKSTIRIATQIPGRPARKKADLHEKTVAKNTNNTGLNEDPMSCEPKLCTTPIFMPRRWGEDSSIMIDCVSGTIGPSATPISMRAKNRTRKEFASPDTKEKAPNNANAATTYFFRPPSWSLRTLDAKPDSAHVTSTAAESKPIWVFVTQIGRV